jgi:histidyl-tRNA synthetase
LPYETLAVGGRYDNVVAHYQPSEVPVAVGVRFFCQKFLQKIIAYENKQMRNPTGFLPAKQIDVYIVSLGDMTMEKM